MPEIETEEDLDKALAAVDAGDVLDVDENGNVFRKEPMSDEEYAAWEKRMGITASTPSP